MQVELPAITPKAARDLVEGIPAFRRGTMEFRRDSAGTEKLHHLIGGQPVYVTEATLERIREQNISLVALARDGLLFIHPVEQEGYAASPEEWEHIANDENDIPVFRAMALANDDNRALGDILRIAAGKWELLINLEELEKRAELWAKRNHPQGPDKDGARTP